MSQISNPGSGEQGSPGSFIIVPPNDVRYQEPDTMRRLESFVRRRLPGLDIEVPWIVQPRIDNFTVVAHGIADEISRAEAKETILRTLAEFDPDAPEGWSN